MAKLTAEQIIELVEASYFYNVDNKNLDDVIACFTEDAELTVQTAHVTHRGHDEIRRMFGDFMRDTPVIYHGDYSHVVDVDNQLIASQFIARNELAAYCHGSLSWRIFLPRMTKFEFGARPIRYLWVLPNYARRDNHGSLI